MTLLKILYKLLYLNVILIETADLELTQQSGDYGHGEGEGVEWGRAGRDGRDAQASRAVQRPDGRHAHTRTHTHVSRILPARLLLWRLHPAVGNLLRLGITETDVADRISCRLAEE